jgi:hypothetical protein
MAEKKFDEKAWLVMQAKAEAEAMREGELVEASV